MNISLREITEENFFDCTKLKVADDQTGFVTDNILSIAQSKVFSFLIPLAVYDDKTLVGFTLHGRNPKLDQFWIVRLMIDATFQGKGFGKQATLKLIERMSKNKDCAEIFLSFVPGNKIAKKLYLNVGFKPTGETDEDGEIYMRYQVDNAMVQNGGK